MDINLAYGILAALCLSFILSLFQKRKKQSNWEGVVTKIKEHNYNYGGDMEYNSNFKDYVYIYYRTDKGKKGKLQIYKETFDSLYPGLKVGDPLIKQAGSMYPNFMKDNS